MSGEAQCPRCLEWMVSDRLADHLRYAHAETAVCPCGCLRVVPQSPHGRARKFALPACRVANEAARYRAAEALAAFKLALGIP